mmetsp:Transcript_26683/g.59687  ORF Transcript_26683/g.59687 Transcript_26683/m.59687 type:complete len:233 (+) Transcript_26683:458-1156(+)
MARFRIRGEGLRSGRFGGGKAEAKAPRCVTMGTGTTNSATSTSRVSFPSAVTGFEVVRVAAPAKVAHEADSPPPPLPFPAASRFGGSPGDGIWSSVPSASQAKHWLDTWYASKVTFSSPPGPPRAAPPLLVARLFSASVAFSFSFSSALAVAAGSAVVSRAATTTNPAPASSPCLAATARRRAAVTRTSSAVRDSSRGGCEKTQPTSRRPSAFATRDAGHPEFAALASARAS